MPPRSSRWPPGSITRRRAPASTWPTRWPVWGTRARAIDTLVRAAADGELSWDAIEGLEAVGAVDRLADLVDKAPDTEHRLRAAAALLARAPDHAAADRARAALEASLTGWRTRRRALAVELVGKVGGEWAIGALERTAAARPRMRGEIEPVLRALREEPTS
jgi:hypothetical protein